MKFVAMLAAAVVGGFLVTGDAEAAPMSTAPGLGEIQADLGSTPLTPVACRTVTRRVCTGRRCRTVTRRSCSPNRACRVSKVRDCKVRRGRRVCTTTTRRVCGR